MPVSRTDACSLMSALAVSARRNERATGIGRPRPAYLQPTSPTVTGHNCAETDLARARDDVAEASPEQIHAQRAINAAVEQRAAGSRSTASTQPRSLPSWPTFARSANRHSRVDSIVELRRCRVDKVRHGCISRPGPTATALTAASSILDSSDMLPPPKCGIAQRKRRLHGAHERPTAVCGQLGRLAHCLQCACVRCGIS